MSQLIKHETPPYERRDVPCRSIKHHSVSYVKVASLKIEVQNNLASIASSAGSCPRLYLLC